MGGLLHLPAGCPTCLLAYKFTTSLNSCLECLLCCPTFLSLLPASEHCSEEKSLPGGHVQQEHGASPENGTPPLDLPESHLEEFLALHLLYAYCVQVNTITRRIPGSSKLNTGRLTVSLAESICFRAAIKPVNACCWWSKV